MNNNFFNKLKKSLNLALYIIISCFFFTGCSESENLPAGKWLSIKSASGFSYISEDNNDNKIDAKKSDFTNSTFSDNIEWNTPEIRYKQVYFEVIKPFEILALAFELKTSAIEGFNLDIEVQLYKELSLPSNWEDFTDEAKMLWEKENRIKDKQTDSIFVSHKNTSALSVTFDTGKNKLDTSYQVRVLFTNISQNIDMLKKFQIDNFIVMTEGV